MPREGERDGHSRRRGHGRRSRSRSLSPRDGRRKQREKRRRHASSGSSRSRSWSRSRSRSPHSRTKHHRDSKEKREARRKEKEEKDEKRKQKELMKALETPEEKRQRRLAKKEAKDRKQREKEGWDKDYLTYTNTDNPFGDHHLLQKFVWKEKLKQEASDLKLSKKEIERRDRLRQEETKRELEKVKNRRIEREREKEAREEEMALLQRMKEAEMFKEWESQEDGFHLQQAKLRSKVRIEAGRAKPIDLLAKYIQSSEEDMDIEVQEPYLLLRGLNIVDLEDLLEDIKVYRDMEVDTNTDFWSDMITICREEISKLKKLEEAEGGGSQGAQARGSVNASVADDVVAIFKGKTYKQLQVLEGQINEKVHSSDPGTDVSYWESLLQQLKAFMARARLRDQHQELLRKKLFFLKQQQLQHAEDGSAEDSPLFPAGASDQQQAQEEQQEEEEEEVGEGEEVKSKPGPSGTGEEPDTLIDEDDLLRRAYENYESGGYSPKLLKLTDVEEDQLVSVEEDKTSRETDRQRVASGGSKVVKEYGSIEMTRSVGEDGQAEEEYNFDTEVNLGRQDPIWKEKYRPRKPRFFNRVHTGFEWNKYNQTHYDTDNPPPKIVQGYKFNIFYSDLIDKRKTPRYKLIPCTDDPDFAILRFSAGPPYEDIGFKIVNREWESSSRHGFRCQFSNNILQLWFRFKRNRYRR